MGLWSAVGQLGTSPGVTGGGQHVSHHPVVSLGLFTSQQSFPEQQEGKPEMGKCFPKLCLQHVHYHPIGQGKLLKQPRF